MLSTKEEWRMTFASPAPRFLRHAGPKDMVQGFIVCALLLLAHASFPQVAPAPETPPRNPLDQHISLRMKKVTLPAFLEEVGRQSRLHFIIYGDLDRCTITAFLKNLTAREVLQLLLERRGLTYQRGGRSDTYVVSPRTDASVCTLVPPAHQPTGSCSATQNKPISLKCKDAALSEFAELVFDQSEASFVFWGGSEDYPISVRLRKATLEKAMGKMGRDKALDVRRVGQSNAFIILPRKP